MTEGERKTIYERMNLLETEDLKEIWVKQNKDEWTELALEVVGDVLIERLGELPSEKPDDDIDDTESLMVPNRIIEPEFYNPDEVKRLQKWLKWASKGVLFFLAIKFIYEITPIVQMVSSLSLQSAFDILYMLFFIIISPVVYYFIIVAFTKLLPILMKMEYNSRGVTPPGKDQGSGI